MPVTGLLTPDARLRVFSDLGIVLPGAKLNTYVTGTVTPLAAYTDALLATPHANPIVASAAGLFAAIYLTPGVAYKLVLTTSADVPVWTADPVLVPVTGLTSAEVTALITALGLGFDMLQIEVFT